MLFWILNLWFPILNLGLPLINWEKRKTTNDGLSWCYTAKIESIPAPYQAQWKVKIKDASTFTPIDVNAEEYKGSSNSLPCPVLVIRQTELENQYHLEVNNFVGSTIKEINGKIWIFFLRNIKRCRSSLWCKIATQNDVAVESFFFEFLRWCTTWNSRHSSWISTYV